MKQLIIRKLIVDEYNEIFDAQGMQYIEFPSIYEKIRVYTNQIMSTCPDIYREGNLLEQQISEIIKNGIKHGNKKNPEKKLKVWFDFRKRVRIIVEDEGDGFKELEAWNEFYRKRQEALYREDFNSFLELAAYKGVNSTADDGGNSLIAALEFWNGGMIFNNKKNKVGVIRWYTNGSRS
ncbi:MAG TPA: ATP-binding protein [Spirochaetia bacterium]|nr:ATP-binding protein [Spirochaetales bacterium]HOT58587.1 ATP-binding protein [Spirochaetales bacterium]HPD80230.1 ATP-binding protein [Spirochaetales bacterium]HRS65236.1 ATP-binding protein [Spirochaetia bacterium]HRV27555.1 ATP-binding protein [Spirochaetia bacterium]